MLWLDAIMYKKGTKVASHKSKIFKFMKIIASLVLRVRKKSKIWTKAEFLQVGTFLHIHLFAWEILLIKKLDIEETETI